MDFPRLGVLLNAEYSAAELIRLGVLAEELGYRSFMYVDVRFHRECYIGLASVAMHTKRILLATGVTDPYSRHPAITAASVATLDELSDGRAVLGLGLGGAGFKELGIHKTLPVAALRESIGAIRRLWRGEEVTLDGKVISLSKGRLQFTPVRDRIPIVIATQGEQISRLSGELADGVLIANTVSEAGARVLRAADCRWRGESRPAVERYRHQPALGGVRLGRRSRSHTRHATTPRAADDRRLPALGIPEAAGRERLQRIRDHRGQERSGVAGGGRRGPADGGRERQRARRQSGSRRGADCSAAEA